MQVQLIVDDEDKKGQIIPINIPTFMIGRAKGCHLRSPSTHVSRQHCIIHIRNHTVTIQDLGGENGTYVNGNRLSAPQTLENGDKLAVGTHKFTVSIGTEAVSNVNEAAPPKMHVSPPPASPQAIQPPTPNQAARPPAQEPELMFDVRYEGQLVSVTKNRLFDLAKKGKVQPDDLIVIAGTKVFADSIDGIEFGDESPTASVFPSASSTAALPTIPAAAANLGKNGGNGSAGSSGVSPFALAAAADESSGYVPPLQRRTMPVRGTPTIEEKIVTSYERERYDPSEKVDLLTRGKQLLAIVLLAAGVSAGIWFFYSDEEKPKDIFMVEGTVMLDGEPVQGASVTLTPRGEGGMTAGGLTNVRGQFRVTAGSAPVGSGAKAGEYDVKLSKVKIENSKKVYLIPQKYGNPSTSGLAPVRVESSGSNSFTFTLTTAEERSQEEE